MSGRIVWIASYPKSGSTWVRAFLSHLQRPEGGETDLDINALIGDWASSRKLLEQALGVSTRHFNRREIDRLRPLAYRFLSRQSGDTLWLKTHERLATARQPLPVNHASITEAVIYILRDPRDIAVSYAHHLGCDLEQSIDHLLDDRHHQSGEGRHYLHLVDQWIGRWDEHVRSWMTYGRRRSTIPFILLRYESLLSDPVGEFGRLCEGLGRPVNPARLQQAVAACAFEKLQSLEQHHGFREKPANTSAFFRAGGRKEPVIGNVRRLEQSLAETMREWGYG